MYVVIEKPAINILANEKPIVDFEGDSLIPKVCTVQKSTDINGVSDLFLGIDLYCQISTMNYLRIIKNNNGNVSDAQKTPVNVELRLSKFDLPYYQAKASETATQNYQKTHDGKTRKRILGQAYGDNRSGTSGQYVAASSNYAMDAIGASASFKIANKQTLYKDTHKVGQISFTGIQNSTKKKILVVKERPQQEVDLYLKKQQDSFALNQDVFKKLYLSMIANNDDPAILFQDDFMKTSFKDKRGGLSNVSNKKNDNYQKRFRPIFDNITTQIKSNSEMLYEFDTNIQNENLKTFSTRINISLNKLRSLGNRFFVLLISKNIFGMNLEAQSYAINLSDIEKQLKINGTSYHIKTARLNNNVSILTAGSSDINNNIDFTLHAKVVSRIKPFEYCYYNTVDSNIIKRGASVTYKDGTINKNKKRPTFFKPSDNIFYRTTLNYINKAYDNCIAATDRGKFKNEMIPRLTVVAKTLKSSMKVEVSYMSNNIAAIRPMKRFFKGKTHVRGQKRFLINTEGEEITNFVNVKNTHSVSFEDIEVYRGTCYEYFVECIMLNGEKKIAYSTFIEEFEEPTGSVAFSKPIVTNDYTPAAPLSEKNYDNVKRRVSVSFNVKKVQNEIDKILQNMFGNLFELFKSDLQEIRDLQGFVVSIEVVRIDLFTGEAETVTKLTPNENGECDFTDINVPYLNSVRYKLIPRVTPALDIISLINEKAKLISKKEIFKSGRFTRSTNERVRASAQLNILSKPGNKMATRNAFMRGLIESQTFQFTNANLDFFLNSSTGDIFYFDVQGLDAFKVSTNFKVANGKVSNISIPSGLQARYASNRTVENFKTQNFKGQDFVNDFTKKRDMKMCDVSFTVSEPDVYVDFYVMFIKENNQVYLDGIIHSSDDYEASKNYSYLVKHEGSFGIIEYYAVAFYKNGYISLPKLIAAQNIE